MDSTTATPGAQGSQAFRLPRTVEPETYRMEIEPNVATATFTGTLAIDAMVHETVGEIVLNAAELVISDVEVVTADGTALPCGVEFHDVLEQVVFRPSSDIVPGPCTVSCRFSGTLNDKLRGFYRSTYTGPDGETQTIATTQFESVDARRCFPCFDEPDFKAVFDITLVVDPEVDALSNSPVVASEQVGDKRRVRFSPTMKMSTYLVALVVGKLESTETVDVDGVPLRVVTMPGKSSLGHYALEVGAFALRFFTEYFNIPYPGEKVDLVAIPDFAAGAMENLGCITFRDTALLVNPAEAARTELERVADVISHELAHMWFGDLVTMGWWEGIWLNEAFATFMEMLCVDAFRPSWERWVSFAPSREAALAIDAVHSTRPIEYPVGPPKEAEGMFDLLTYEKGASVLRMLEQYIGPDVFRDGVRSYLKAHAYGNTVTTDLWDALEDASGAPVRDVMDTFILQGGHPLVTLHGDILSQQPFELGPVPAGTTSSIGTTWNVPVAVRAAARRRQAGRAGGPPRPRGRADARARGGRRAGRGQRRGLGRVPRRLRARAPAGPGHAPARAHAARAGRTSRRHLGHHAGRPVGAARVPAAGLLSRPRVRPRPVVVRGGGAEPDQPDRAARRPRRIARGGGGAHRPRPPAPGVRRPAGRERAHADAARPGHQPPGHGGDRRGRADRGGPPLRRLAHRRGLRPAHSARHRDGDARLP